MRREFHAASNPSYHRKAFPCGKALFYHAYPFLISLLPVCRLAFYAHPAGDDYAYGVAAHLAWTDTHSLSAVLAAAVSNVKGYYTSWQGTYSSIFLMSLQPAIFSQRLYFLTTFLMLLW